MFNLTFCILEQKFGKFHLAEFFNLFREQLFVLRYPDCLFSNYMRRFTVNDFHLILKFQF